MKKPYSIRLYSLAALSVMLFAGEAMAAEKPKPATSKPAAPASHHVAVKLEAVPANVRETIVAQAHGDKVAALEQFTKDKDGTVSYVAQIVGKDGKHRRLTVDSAGKVVAKKPQAHS